MRLSQHSGFEYVSPSISFSITRKPLQSIYRLLTFFISSNTMRSANTQGPLNSPLSESPSSRSPDSTHSSEPTTPGPTKDSYFGNTVYESPPASDSCDSESSYNGDDDDAHTDSTLDDAGLHPEFGHPLQRMPRIRSADHGLNYDADAELKALLRSASLSQPSVPIPDSTLV